MTTIVTRAGKGTSLTWTEADANFNNLNTDKLETSGGNVSGKINFSIGSTQFQYNSVDVGGFYAPQTYSKYIGVGVTTDRTWSNTLGTVRGVTLGSEGGTSLVNYGDSITYLFHAAYIGSDYAVKYATTGVTPAYIDMSGGQIKFLVAAASGTAGNSASFNTPLAVYGADQSVRVNGEILGAVNGTGFRNRIINGNFRIDQRNAGAAVTATLAGVYGMDRWKVDEDTDGSFTIQRVTTTPPAGFSHICRLTVTSADASIGAAQYAILRQQIEGNNLVDLAWGSADAETVTLSFWARSSITGTFSGSLRNSAGTRSYCFTYTISAANTWEKKVITVSGETSGTWLTDTGIGCTLTFSLGCGSNLLSTANQWNNGNYYGATGETALISNNGATLDFAGVQFEVGPVASPFERRSFTQELQLCYRYYQKTFPLETAPAQSVGINDGTILCPINPTAGTANLLWADHRFPVEMRVTPAITTYNPNAANANWRNSGGTGDFPFADGGGSTKAWQLRAQNVTTNQGAYIHAAFSAEL